MGSEINQQLMCDAGLPFLLLEKCEEAFTNEHHPLNAPLTKLFERLAGQSLHPKVLRFDFYKFFFALKTKKWGLCLHFKF